MVLTSVNKLMVYKIRDHSNQYGDILINNVNIMTDSTFVCDILNINGYPKLNYYMLIQNIFKLCKVLSQYQINVNIIKIPSHSGIEGNEMADAVAKQAAQISRDCKFGKSKIIKYNTFKNPANVDIAKDLIKLRKFQNERRRKEWIQEKQEKQLVKQQQHYQKMENENKQNRYQNDEKMDFFSFNN